MPKIKIPEDATVRKCLRCRKEFPSHGFHNRMCDPCRTVDTPITDAQLDQIVERSALTRSYGNG